MYNNEEDGYWYQAKKDDTLFQFYQDGVDAEGLKNFLNGNVSISEENFVQVVVDSFSVSNKVPTQVDLVLQYYQNSTTEKRLIKSSVSFSGFVDPKNFDEGTIFNYTLNIDYKPLSHTELMIEFSLPWFVYFTMYILVGILTIFMTAVFMIYHRIVSRKSNHGFWFWAYCKAFLPPSLYGLLYVMIPQFVYMIIIAVVFTHHIMDWRFQSYFCDALDDDCLQGTIWDRLYLTDVDAEKRSKL